MVCCIVLKPPAKSQKLLLTRQRQKELIVYLEALLDYRPFVFNSVQGVYIFVKRKESFEQIKSVLSGFLYPETLNQMEFINTKSRPQFFKNVIQRVLTSRENSAWAWKRFINSFLTQLDPFSRLTSYNNMVIFKNFHNYIKQNGTKLQRKFYKNRMKILRERVSLENVERMLE